MIFIGTDIVPLIKIEKMIQENGARFLNHVFTRLEQNICDTKNSPSIHYSGKFAAKEASLILYPNVNSTLIALSKWGLKLGVVSDAPSREAWMRICSVNFHHIFDAVVTFQDTRMHKPSPEPFEKISSLLDIPPENSLMVGDWPERDVIGAKKLGMKTAFAKYGDVFGTKESGADYDILNVKEVLSIVKKENQV